ncbi:hypothetical protein FQA39_LY03396 [Lamprigera yunnana]|nr:hypothetical protein FQA39_LY03396 [Lamprigera yunnana]
MYAKNIIDLLQNSGAQFTKHEDEGLESLNLAEVLMCSGIMLMDNNSNLPHNESEFFELKVAEQVNLERIGPQHLVRSDSLLTDMGFFKMKEMFFEDTIDDTKFYKFTE